MDKCRWRNKNFNLLAVQAELVLNQTGNICVSHLKANACLQSFSLFKAAVTITDMVLFSLNQLLKEFPFSMFIHRDQFQLLVIKFVEAKKR